MSTAETSSQPATEDAPEPEGHPQPLPDAAHDACLRHLQALLRIDTRNPPGNERPAIDYVRAALAEAGVDSQVFEPAPGRANLVARLRGDGSEEALLLSGHVDVVPVEREQWSRDPFGGEVHEGCVWGRGAVDMKGMVAMELATFLQIARARPKLRRDLVLLVLADEEAGMDHGSKWMVENEPDAIRAGWCLNEVGAFSTKIGERTLYPIGVAEKGFAWIELISRGQPGHGSMPHGDNAVIHLARALERLGRRPLGRAVHPAARAFISQAAAAAGGTQGLVLRGLLNPLTAPAALRAIRAADPEKARVLAAMLHFTVSATGLRAGEKENVIPSEARAILDGRFPPGTTADDLIARVRGELTAHIEARELSRGEPTEAPLDTPLYRLLCETVERRDPGAKAVPWLNVGFTDSANLSRLGMKCYGFFPLKLPPDLPFAALFHGHDERVPVSSLRWGLETFHEVVHRFTTGEA
jgi:acetylornithine deacetylase/succinyl-diaminopimelate desuccinylase-like protein